jgi:hypothetical protein
MLVGVRDIRDYNIYYDEDKTFISGGSAFNIKSDSLLLPRFKREHVAAIALLRKHDTRQEFTPQAIDKLMDWTSGQPWCVMRMMELASSNLNRLTIGPDEIDDAARVILNGKETHIEQMGPRLVSDERYRGILLPLIQGIKTPRVSDSDIEFLVDQGLITRVTSADGLSDSLEFSNKLYAQVR